MQKCFIVCRSAVDENHLEVWVLQCCYRLQRGAYVATRIAAHGDDAYERHCGVVSHNFVLVSRNYRVFVLLLEFYEAVAHLLNERFHCRHIVDIVHLVRVVEQVVEFPMVDVVVEVNEFVAPVAHAVVALH